MKKISFAVLLLLLTVSKAWAIPVLWLDNGHSYDLIPFSSASLTWQEALSSSNSLTYMGSNGYLATITSTDENSFLNTVFNTTQDNQFAWIAGYEPVDDGVWKWAAGSELDIQFSIGVNPTAPFNYANWGGIEPNDNKPGEDYAMFNIGNSFAGIGPGQWADAINTPNSLDPVVGYLVEFETSDETNAVPEPSTVLLLSFGLLSAIGLHVRNSEFWRIFLCRRIFVR